MRHFLLAPLALAVACAPCSDGASATVEDPDGAEGGFVSVINPDSLKTISAWVEPSLAGVEPEWICQFERLGYFVADRHDHQPGKPVFNRTVGLRDARK